MKIVFLVSLEYPITPPDLTIKSNLGGTFQLTINNNHIILERIVHIYDSFCLKALKNLSQGYSFDWVFGSATNSVKNLSGDDSFELTRRTLLDCKRDVEFLHKQNVLHADSDNKKSRRQLSRLNRDEFNKIVWRYTLLL